MKTKQNTSFKLAKNMVPVGLLLTIQHQSGVEATQVDTQAHIQEIASLVSSALNESEEGAALDASVSALSTEEINAQIHSTIEEAIKSQESAKAENKANSKLGFLQKVVTLDCFFGGSDCLFKDKKSMMEGKVTEFAQKRFEEGNQDVNKYLAQVKSQVNRDLQANAAIKSIDNAAQAPPTGDSNLQTESQYVERLERQNQEQRLDKQLHDSVQGLLKLNQKTEADSAPNAILAKTEGPTPYNPTTASQSAQLVKVPIDEKEAIGLTVSPTYHLDDVMSVTLKAFRKVVGYDTFDSIRRGQRDEKKDTNDYYNVTVSMMIKRKPAEPAAVYEGDIFSNGKTLKDLLDKGFPYDDGDIDLTSKLAAPEKTVAQVVGKLNGENITKQNLKNLVSDKTSPVTGALVQIDSQKSDADGLFKLMDANVTRGNLKNLVTDKPSPITVGLAQKSDADGLFKLMDANVTRGNLKNLVTDKPSPITVGLAQTSGVPVYVNPESTLYSNTQAATDFGFVDIPVGLDELSFVQQKSTVMPIAPNTQQPNNFAVVERNGNKLEFAQTKSSSTIMPLAPESQKPGNLAVVERNANRLELAQVMPLAPESQKPGNLAVVERNANKLELAQVMPIAPESQKPGNLAVVERNANRLELAQTESKVMPLAPNTQQPNNFAVVERNANRLELAQVMPLAPESQKPGNLAVVERNANKLELAQVPPVDSSVVQQTAPGDFNIVDQEAVDSTLVQTGKVSQKSATGLN